MSDLALTWNDDAGFADLAMLGADLATDDGLNTAITISLFSDGLARPDDVPSDGTDDRRGWWGDSFPAIEGDAIGSRLWLLARAKRLPETLLKVREYAAEALAWLVADGIASAVDVAPEWHGDSGVGLQVVITRPGQRSARYFYVWEAANAL